MPESKLRRAAGIVVLCRGAPADILRSRISTLCVYLILGVVT